MHSKILYGIHSKFLKLLFNVVLYSTLNIKCSPKNKVNQFVLQEVRSNYNFDIFHTIEEIELI